VHDGRCSYHTMFFAGSMQLSDCCKLKLSRMNGAGQVAFLPFKKSRGHFALVSD
jgi:hypothetical protein